jgi:hypothetical protein
MDNMAAQNGSGNRIVAHKTIVWHRFGQAVDFYIKACFGGISRPYFHERPLHILSVDWIRFQKQPDC